MSFLPFVVAFLSKAARENSPVKFPFSFGSLRLLQALGDDPDVCHHHCDDAKYDHVFHVSPHFLLGSEIGSSATGFPVSSTQPGHG